MSAIERIMPGNACEGLATSPIFNNTCYEREALCLFGDQCEDILDEEIANEARESGIEDPYRYLNPEDLSTAVSTLSVSTEQRSSISVHSQESHSTGITSHPSRTSKDIAFQDQRPSSRTASAPLPRGSLSIENYDAVLERFRPNIRHTQSSSTASTVTSTLSTSSWSNAINGRRKNRPSLLSIFKKESR